MQHLSSFLSAPTLGLGAAQSWSYFKTTRAKVVEIFSQDSFQATGCPSSAFFQLLDGSLQLRETDSCHHHHHQTPSGHEWSNPTKLKNSNKWSQRVQAPCVTHTHTACSRAAWVAQTCVEKTLRAPSRHGWSFACGRHGLLGAQSSSSK